MTPETFPEVKAPVLDPRGILLWDGNCGLCAWSAREFQRLMKTPVGVQPVQRVQDSLPPVLVDAARKQVLWIDADGTPWGGSLAVARAFRATGHPVIAWLMENRAARPLVYRCYHWIAAHRHRLGSPACPPSGQS